MKKKRSAVASLPTVTSVPTEPVMMFDIPRAAQALCTTVWAVRSLIWENKLHASKLGHRWVVSRSELERFVAEQQKKAA